MKRHSFKQATFAALAFIALFSSAYSQAITGFTDIKNWVGRGSNQAALVIDWKDGTGTSSMVWGYRWNGTATGEDMIKAIAAYVGAFDGLSTTMATADGNGDPSLTFYIDTEFSFGDAVYELDYASAMGSHSSGGFNSSSPGYWAYYTADGTALLPASWAFSSVGISGRTLSNNSWDALTWAANFTETAPAAPITAAGSGYIPAPPMAKLSGKAKLNTTNGSLPIKGVAKGEITSVTYRIANGKWRAAHGTKSWKFTAKLKLGRNIITVIAHGAGGDSNPVKVTVTRKR